MNRRLARDFVVVEDQALLRDLCGPGHVNLAFLEQAFAEGDLRADAPGGGVALEGDAGSVRDARRALEIFILRLREGAAGAEADLRAAIFQAQNAGTEERIAPAGRRQAAIAARNAAQRDYMAALRDPRLGLVFGIGPAGTGKTFLAVAAAAVELQAERIRKLIITRPAVEAGERLGFLPGDLAEKVDPYLRPIWDALGELLGPGLYEKHRNAGRIEIAPLAFMRGRTLKDAFVIVDEAQNATRMQMKMALTRLGEGSRMVVTGDPSQVDLPQARDSGLAHAAGLLAGVEGVGIIRFAARDVVRHPLVERIVAAYDLDDRPAATRAPDPGDAQA